jgi:hypothetical protein
VTGSWKTCNIKFNENCFCRHNVYFSSRPTDRRTPYVYFADTRTERKPERVWNVVCTEFLLAARTRLLQWRSLL